jgi:hypothetical protein
MFAFVTWRNLNCHAVEILLFYKSTPLDTSHTSTIKHAPRVLHTAAYPSSYKQSRLRRCSAVMVRVLAGYDSTHPSPSHQSMPAAALPRGLLDSRNLSSERIHSEVILYRNPVSSMSPIPPSPTQGRSSPSAGRAPRTLVILKSRRTPLDLPPSMHRFRICVGRV